MWLKCLWLTGLADIQEEGVVAGITQSSSGFVNGYTANLTHIYCLVRER